MKKIFTAILIILVLAIAIFIGTIIQPKILTIGKKTTADKKVYKVALIYAGGAYEQAIIGLKDGLKNFGYSEGNNIEYISKDVQGDMNQVNSSALEMIELKPSAFYTVATPVTTQAWKTIGNKFPIVFNIVGDPIGAGFAKNYSSSGTNLTGCSNISAELSGKRLEIFKEAFPNLKKVVTFYDPTNAFSLLSIDNTRKAASTLGINLVEKQTKDLADLNSALSLIKAGEYDGIYITPDAMVVSKIELVISKALELGIPTMGHEETLAQKGVTITYGANFYQLGVQCASVIDAVLKGKQPQSIAIQVPKKLDIIINSHNLDLIKATITPEILGRSDKILSQ